LITVCSTSWLGVPVQVTNFGGRKVKLLVQYFVFARGFRRIGLSGDICLRRFARRGIWNALSIHQFE
jgi:hypothetical protein